jgi:hypothetical protein
MTYEVRVSLIELEVGYSRVAAGVSRKCSSQADARQLFDRCIERTTDRTVGA